MTVRFTFRGVSGNVPGRWRVFLHCTGSPERVLRLEEKDGGTRLELECGGPWVAELHVLCPGGEWDACYTLQASAVLFSTERGRVELFRGAGPSRHASPRPSPAFLELLFEGEPRALGGAGAPGKERIFAAVERAKGGRRPNNRMSGIFADWRGGVPMPFWETHLAAAPGTRIPRSVLLALFEAADQVSPGRGPEWIQRVCCWAGCLICYRPDFDAWGEQRDLVDCASNPLLNMSGDCEDISLLACGVWAQMAEELRGTEPGRIMAEDYHPPRLAILEDYAMGSCSHAIGLAWRRRRAGGELPRFLILDGVSPIGVGSSTLFTRLFTHGQPKGVFRCESGATEGPLSTGMQRLVVEYLPGGGFRFGEGRGGVLGDRLRDAHPAEAPFPGSTPFGGRGRWWLGARQRGGYEDLGEGRTEVSVEEAGRETAQVLCITLPTDDRENRARVLLADEGLAVCKKIRLYTGDVLRLTVLCAFRSE